MTSKSELETLIELNYSHKMLANHFSVHKNTIVNWLSKYGLKTRRGPPLSTWQNRKDEILAIVPSVYSITEICRAVGISTHGNVILKLLLGSERHIL